MKRPLYGGDCYNYGLLASGFCDLVVEASMGPYDYLAQVPIIQGAGGVITDWEVESLPASPAFIGRERETHFCQSQGLATL